MKNNHAKTYIIVAIFLSIIGISIAYAALSQQLQIKTTTTVQSSQTSWNIAFESVSCQAAGNAVLGTFETNGTTLTISGFTLKVPNDIVYCSFYIKNKGEVNAKISSVNYEGPTCSGTGTTATADANLVKTYLCHDLVWDNSGTLLVEKGVVIPAGSSRTVRVRHWLCSSLRSLPTNPVTFTNAVYTINFEQA